MTQLHDPTKMAPTLRHGPRHLDPRVSGTLEIACDEEHRKTRPLADSVPD
jgi:hypothetical protein